MNRSFRRMIFGSILTIATCLSLGQAQEDAKLVELKNAAIQKAIRSVENAVIRLDLFPSDNRQPKVGTGVISSSDGLVITSSFLVPKDSTRVVANVGGKKIAAKFLGTDQSRKLTLLQLQDIDNLPFIKLQQTNCRVGESVIAVGRTLSQQTVNVSTGIVSAKKRIWGLATQTDAKISPTNYGGPLVNLKGEVLGILTQISPSAIGDASSEEWYDSGIGFAIPAVNVKSTIKRITESGELERGRVGIKFQTTNPFRANLRVSSCFPRSPAAVAGIKPGDIVTKVDNVEVNTLNQFKNATFRYYANDKIRIETIRRGKKMEFPLTLSGPLSVYRFPYLGIIPSQSTADNVVVVSQIDQLGPSKGKLRAGDSIIQLEDKNVSSLDDLKLSLARFEAGQSIRVTFLRNGETKTTTIKLADLVSDLESESYSWTDGQQVEVETSELKVGGFSNACQLILPKKPLSPSSKLVVFLAETNKINQPGLQNLEQIADSGMNGVLIAYPESVDGWQQHETEFLNLAIRQAIRIYPAFSQTITMTVGETGELACRLALQDRQLVGGFVFINPSDYEGWNLPNSDPGNALHTLILSSGSSRNSISSMQLSLKLKGSGLPCKIQKVSKVGLTPKTLSTIKEWIWLSARL